MGERPQTVDKKLSTQSGTGMMASTLKREVGIYALTDPRDGLVRYVGKATDPEARLRAHVQPGQLDRYRSKKNSWLKGLVAQGLRPGLVLLGSTSEEEANEAERRWIAHFRILLGDKLTNGTEGGDGGAVTDPAAKARIRAAHVGSKHSDETKARMSASHKALITPAERERLGSISNGKPPVRKGEANNKAFLTEAQVVELRELVAAGATMKALASERGLKYQTLHQIVTGLTWKHAGGPIKPKAKKQRLSDSDIREIRLLASQGVTQTTLAARFGVHPSHVSRSIRGATRRSTPRKEA